MRGVTVSLRGEHKGADRAKVGFHCVIWLWYPYVRGIQYFFFLRTLKFYLVFLSLSHVLWLINESWLKKKLNCFYTIHIFRLNLRWHDTYKTSLQSNTITDILNYSLDVWKLTSWMNKFHVCFFSSHIPPPPQKKTFLKIEIYKPYFICHSRSELQFYIKISNVKIKADIALTVLLYITNTFNICTIRP